MTSHPNNQRPGESYHAWAGRLAEKHIRRQGERAAEPTIPDDAFPGVYEQGTVTK